MSDKRKDDRSKKKKGDKHKITNLREFKKFVKINNDSMKNWYDGLDGKWWWGMSEEDAISHIEQGLVPEIETDKVTFISTWGINCGIATYTKYLLDELSIVTPNPFLVNSINEGKLKHKTKRGLVHLQHEFGIVPPKLPRMKNRMIITWHTVSKNTNEAIKNFESRYNVVAHIVHSECTRHDINTSKDIWTVPHGSTLIPEMKKEDARKLLNINIDMPIGFVFGFQSGEKNYSRLIDAAKNTDMHIIISGASHNLRNPTFLTSDKNVTFMNRFLTEDEVNLYALASDLLLFDYVPKDNYSVSGAMHRVIGAGRPVICSDVRHFNDLRHNYNCLKFKNQSRLERCIRKALKDSGKLGIAAREYSEKTSWRKIAKCHIDIYKKYTDISSLRLVK